MTSVRPRSRELAERSSNGTHLRLLWRQGTRELWVEVREADERAFADGRLLEDPGPESGGFWIVPTVLLLAHADDDGARVSTAVIEWAKQHGSLPAFSMAAQLRAYICLRRGSLAESEADAMGGLEHPGVSGFPPYGRVALANVLLARGKPTEAAEVFAQAGSEPAAAGHIRYLQTRARLRAASQHPDEALEDLVACGRLEQEWGLLRTSGQPVRKEELCPKAQSASEGGCSSPSPPPR